MNINNSRGLQSVIPEVGVDDSFASQSSIISFESLKSAATPLDDFPLGVPEVPVGIAAALPLPAEILHKIFEQLPVQTVRTMSRVCKEFQEHSQNLFVRKLNSGTSFSDLGIKNENQAFTFLRSLRLCDKQHIKCLNLSGITFSPERMQELILLLPVSLQELSCSKCGLDDKTILSISAQCPHLLKLDISKNQSITGNSFDKLPKSLKELVWRNSIQPVPL